jgi:hypothetical protein
MFYHENAMTAICLEQYSRVRDDSVAQLTNGGPANEAVQTGP